MPQKITVKDKGYFFEQYKIIVESAEEVSFKRQDANKFYLTVNSALFGAASYLSALHSALPPALISFIGIVISLNWIHIIASYKLLNKAKFRVIHEMEKNLPIALFTNEQDYLQKQNYLLLTHSEKWVPWAFVVLHIAVILVALVATAGVLASWLANIL